MNLGTIMQAFDQIQNEICKHTQTNKKNWRILLDIKDFWLGGIINIQNIAHIYLIIQTGNNEIYY